MKSETANHQGNNGRPPRRSVKDILFSDKRRLALICVLCAVLLVGSTLAAALTANAGTVTNPFTFGETKIIIDEDPYSWTTKKVYLKAGAGEDYVDCVVRAMIIPVFYIVERDGNGAVIPSSRQPTDGAAGALTAPTGNTIVLGDFTFHLVSGWTSNWFYKDGYFYCKKVLSPGGNSVQLLDKVTLTVDNTANREKYANIEVQVEVMADSIQAAGGAPEDAWGVYVNSELTTVSPTPFTP